MIALAIARGRSVGIDVENVSERDASIAVAERYFAPQEIEDLNALPRAMQSRRFFELWTLKESYIKARGMGLSLPLNRFNFQFPTDRSLQFRVDETLNDPAEHWQFWHWAPSSSHVLALCAERIAATVVVINEGMPLGKEEILPIAATRAS
jgi:4'-phosphopantetheinyl transferase